jgi:hypothetical protein
MATDSSRQDPIDVASEDSFPASDPPARTATTGPGHARAGTSTADLDAELRRARLGWRHALIVAGVAMIAAGAGVWKLRSRR